uniref:Uncharacterized protein n=1 Tax=Meloidogyne enterolobii TaxID=390850 RepID=A0A6V7W1T7_MELEN|nr:unnamed protein product [Meloidogyne enterolobii]
MLYFLFSVLYIYLSGNYHVCVFVCYLARDLIDILHNLCFQSFPDICVLFVFSVKMYFHKLRQI